MASSRELASQYERWPYPSVSLLGRLPPLHPWQQSVDYLHQLCGTAIPKRRPRIWIAGCGTFQPHVFATANPSAEILATDLSRTSLKRARWHLRRAWQRNVRLERLDLLDEHAYPDEEFDLIECYGVLMNFDDPKPVLARLAERLAPGGVLRLMVYPRFSRERIFQVQRVARLLGLHAGDPSHPSLLRQVIRRLPRSHPLRHAFDTYPDVSTDAGLVDGFLHVGDRGFTGGELVDLVSSAGLEVRKWFHRPWAQPDAAAQRLGMTDRSEAFVLTYLDLWNELRGNLVPCCVRRDDVTRAGKPTVPSLLRGDGRDPSRRLAQLHGRWRGLELPDRLDETTLRLEPDDVIALSRGELPSPDRLHLGVSGPNLPTHRFDPDEASWLAPGHELGDGALNPVHDVLGRAWSLHLDRPELGLPSLSDQLAAWEGFADPLEDETVPLGLTPFGSYQARPGEIEDWLTGHGRRQRTPSADAWPEERPERLDDLLRSVPGLSANRLDETERVELSALLFSMDCLRVRRPGAGP
ncbi:MAG: class I SAM-dependent methyltransferase [Acidobacteriota bacterium]